MDWARVTIDENSGLSLELDSNKYWERPFYIETIELLVIPIANICYTYNIKNCKIDIFDEVIDINGKTIPNKEAILRFIKIYNKQTPQTDKEIKETIKEILIKNYLKKNHIYLISQITEQLAAYIKDVILNSKLILIKPSIKIDANYNIYSFVRNNMILTQFFATSNMILNDFCYSFASYHLSQLTKEKCLHKEPKFMKFNDILDYALKKEINK